MKKTFKGIISILLVLIIAFCCVGCADEKKLVGKWETTQDWSDILIETLGLDTENDEVMKFVEIDDFEVLYIMEFSSNNTYKSYIDKASMKKAFDNLKQDMRDGLTKYFQNNITENGYDLTVDEYLALAETSLDEIIDPIVTDKAAENAAAEADNEGNFKAKDGKLYLSSGLQYETDEKIYCTYEVTDNSLKLIKQYGDKEDYDQVAQSFDSKMYPMTFKKVK